MTKKTPFILPLLFLSLLFLSTACNRKANTYLYESDGDQFNFPEKELNLKSTGVCFSGGGTRAMTCAAGQMKGLDSLNLWPHIGYISSVSGGTWASSIFTYYRPTKDGPKNDQELLGTPMGAKNLSLDYLKKAISPKNMIHAPTRDLTGRLLECLIEDDLSRGILENPDDIWIDGVGATYLEPFGLYCKKRRYFTLNQLSMESIMERSPKLRLKKKNFYLVHNQKGDATRPFLVMNSTVLGPADFRLRDPQSLTVFNYTPLGIGAAKFREISSGNSTYAVGGGFIEPFAMGGSAPISPLKDCGDNRFCAEIELSKKRKFRLAEAAGTSSSAFADKVAASTGLSIVSDWIADGSIIPAESYWPVQKNLKGAETYHFADGGSLDNFGLLTLLQRKVQKIVVFINTDTKIDTSFDPDTSTPNSSTIDTDFYTLFGDSSYDYGNHVNNHVFSTASFKKVFKQFKECIRDGKTVMATDTTETLANEWWGIPAGQKVEILWVHNYSVPEWESKLPKETQKAITANKLFPNFPWYNTIRPQKKLRLVQLSNGMAKLLYELQFWNVYHNKKIEKFLKE